MSLHTTVTCDAFSATSEPAATYSIASLLLRRSILGQAAVFVRLTHRIMAFPDMDPNEAIEKLARRKRVCLIWKADSLAERIVEIRRSQPGRKTLSAERIIREVNAVTDGLVHLDQCEIGEVAAAASCPELSDICPYVDPAQGLKTVAQRRERRHLILNDSRSKLGGNYWALDGDRCRPDHHIGLPHQRAVSEADRASVPIDRGGWASIFTEYLRYTLAFDGVPSWTWRSGNRWMS